MGLRKWFMDKLIAHLTKDESPRRAYLCDFGRISHEARPADVLLIEGRNRVSKIIQRLTRSPWSHAALYIGHIHNIDDPQIRETIQKNFQGKPNEKLVIESIVGNGTVISPLAKYKDDHIRICRPTGLAYEDAQRVIKFATNSLGRKYDIRHILDLARFFMGSWLIPSRWKSVLFSIDNSDTSEEICSKMLAQAFTSVKFPVLPLIREGERHHLEFIRRNANLFVPSDFDYSPYFDIIKYPIFNVKDVAPYRHLPWQDDLISNDDEGVVGESD